MEKKLIAVFGGSFNPPLNSHFSLAQEIINEIDGIEKVIFVPVSKKYDKAGLESNEDRYNMLKLVCDKNDRLYVSDIEHRYNERQLNTFETMELLQSENPDYELLFVIGTDNLKELYWWGNIDSLLTKYRILVFARGNENIDEIIESQEFLKKYRDRFIRLNQQITTNLSSTYVRNMIKENKDIRYLIPDEVLEYIKNNNLYRG